MKVLNLQCSYRHSFEGWFASEDDFQSQLARRLVECPLCADSGIQKLPSAPRLNLGGHAMSSAELPQGDPPDRPQALGGRSEAAPISHAAAALQAGPSQADEAAFLKALRHVVATTENVGKRFAHEARAIHYGDAENRSIRGQASLQETIGLLEEGIEVMSLPMPVALKETLQ